MGEAALVLAPFSPGALETLGHSLSVTYESWTDTRKLYSPEELSQRINEEGICNLIVEADFVFEEVFGESPPLKFLGVCRNSLDHIDVQAATEHGVVVVNAPGRNAQAVAELTIGLMLSLSRGIPKLNCYVRNGKWQGPVEPYLSMRGVELGGKTLGILGLGSIGKKVAGIGRAMGMQVLAYDPYARTPGARKAGALLGDLEQVAKLSDFLSIHTPDTAETQGSGGPPHPGNDEARLLYRKHRGLCRNRGGWPWWSISSPGILREWGWTYTGPTPYHPPARYLEWKTPYSPPHRRRNRWHGGKAVLDDGG